LGGGNVSILGVTFELTLNGILTKIDNGSLGTFGVAGISIWNTGGTAVGTIIGRGQIFLSPDGVSQGAILQNARLVLNAPSGPNSINLSMDPTTHVPTLSFNGSQVLASTRTGWTPCSGTALRTGWATGSATLVQVAETLKALIDDLHFSSGGMGIIGT